MPALYLSLFFCSAQNLFPTRLILKNITSDLARILGGEDNILEILANQIVVTHGPEILRKMSTAFYNIHDTAGSCPN